MPKGNFDALQSPANSWALVYFFHAWGYALLGYPDGFYKAASENQLRR